jgi:hypothetical protein
VKAGPKQGAHVAVCQVTVGARELAQYRHANAEELIARAVLAGRRFEETPRMRGCAGVRPVSKVRA